MCEMLMFHWYTLVSKHKLSWGSWVCFLESSVLCVYLLSEAPPICCYHGDSPSWVSCWQGTSVWNSVRKLELVREGVEERGKGRSVGWRIKVATQTTVGAAWLLKRSSLLSA